MYTDNIANLLKRKTGLKLHNQPRRKTFIK